MANNPDFESMSQEITSSRAYKIERQLEWMQSSFYIFDRNYKELKRVLDACSDPKRIPPFFGDGKKEEMKIILGEVRRLLHNFLAAAKMLIEHTRSNLNSISQQRLLLEYQSKIVKRFANDPLSRFIQDFRNYLLHYALPATLTQFQIGRNPTTNQTTIKSDAILDKGSLIQYSNWSTDAKKFLRSLPDSPHLADVIEPYYQHVCGFHNWLFGRIMEIEAQELKWLSEKKKQFRIALGEPD